ncbi:FecR family protein [Chitinophaga jiangningensis]|uniref:FecR family protein n=1 Tax=Chitinophaga jiangningensis TaxID=1419482 RepID=A0A1M6W2N2_9BACT|nr:FecR family protein [Chitinophaga jiangningensis]SHK87775.1 FecR family protein [Chitinophaga jiangningensis]
MNKQEVIVLFRKYDDGTITEQERLTWEEWCNNITLEAFNEMLREAFPERTFPKGQLLPHRQEALALALTAAEQRDASPVVPMGRWRWAAAAAAVVLVAGAAWWYNGTRPTVKIDDFKAAAKIQPGRQGAMLTLANGQQVLLDSLGNGLIAAQQGTNLRMDAGKLKYDVLKKDNEKIAWNTITTPRSRQFTLILPDGSMLWMNAASSVKFPVSFAGNERRIEVSGEVYIEVAPQENQPFYVSLTGQTAIEVLGTSFNISAYNDDKHITATLIAGAINVKTTDNKIQLKPGQQALVKENGSQLSINTNPDLTKVMAWKNRQFNFEGANIKDVMKQLSRWYDIEVVYEGTPPNIDFGGKLSMDMSLDGVLHALKDAEVHFKMDGRQLTIMQ